MTAARVALMLIGCLALSTAARGQSLSERIADYREKQARREAQQDAQAGDQTPGFVPIPQRLAQTVLDPVELDAVPLRQIVTWFTRATDIPVVVHWDKLESEGVDVEAPITLRLRHVPAEQFLGLVTQQASSEVVPLRLDVTPWYVELLTRRQANVRVVTRIYPVQDLVMEIPRFSNAPSLDLQAAISGGGSGGSRSNRTSGGALFRDEDREVNESIQEERGQELAQLICDTIEPDIWIENGGEHSSIRYSRGRLIVRAPRYVHRMIGGPSSGAIGPRPAAAAPASTPAATESPAAPTSQPAKP